MKHKIQKNVSLYNGKKIYDFTIMKYVGIKTYCTLQKYAPDLYNDYLECLDEYKESFFQLDCDILDINLTPLEIKTQLVGLMVDDSDKYSPFVKKLKNSSYGPEEYPQSGLMNEILFIIFVFLFMFFIAFIIYYIGLWDSIISPNSKYIKTKYIIEK